MVEAGQSECVIAMIRPRNRGHGGGGQGKKEVMKRPHKAEVDGWGYCSSKLPLVCDQKVRSDEMTGGCPAQRS